MLETLRNVKLSLRLPIPQAVGTRFWRFPYLFVCLFITEHLGISRTTGYAIERILLCTEGDGEIGEGTRGWGGGEERNRARLEDK